MFLKQKMYAIYLRRNNLSLIISRNATKTCRIRKCHCALYSVCVYIYPTVVSKVHCKPIRCNFDSTDEARLIASKHSALPEKYTTRQ